MPSIRIGYSTDFNLNNELVGIGSTTATSTLDVAGQIVADNTAASGGVSTFREYQGFQQIQQDISNNIVIDNGSSGNFNSLSGEIRISGETTVSSSSTITGGKLETLTITDKFAVPLGDTNSRDNTPEAGTTRFNQDFGTLEFFDGNNWKTVNSYARYGAAGRGFILGGVDASGSYTNNIQSFQITTLGNTTDFGNLITAKVGATGNASDGIRGICAGGITPSATVNEIDYYTMASGGQTVDFGNLTEARYSLGGVSSSTRGCFAGGWVPNNSNVIDYVEIATTGDALDFGDLSEGGNHGNPGMQSPVRGIFCGGYGSFSPDVNSPYAYNRMQMITMASKGNTTRFGELNVGGARGGAGGNSIRGIFAGGNNLASSAINALIEHVTIASEGNGTNFGELTVARRNNSEVADTATRVVFCAGIADDGTAPAATNYMDYITIASAGNAIDFGDLLGDRKGHGSFSDSHGGLGGF